MNDQKDDATLQDQSMQSNAFYSDDVQAAALADNNMNDDLLIEDKETPVTSGNMQIGDLDIDAEVGRGSENSYDEETVPGGEDVNGEDDIEA